MTRLDALKALAEKVEAGAVVSEQDTTELWPMLGGEWQLCRNAALAANGSLDAAKALHEAVLPGWVARHTWGGSLVENPTSAPIPYTHVFRPRKTTDDDPIGENSSGYRGDNPARAWLLAILRALIAQEAAE